jgi:hypothetical protein
VRYRPNRLSLLVEALAGSLGKFADFVVRLTESAPDLAVLDVEHTFLPQRLSLFVEKLSGSLETSADSIKAPCDFVNWLADFYEERSENDSESAKETFC